MMLLALSHLLRVGAFGSLTTPSLCPCADPTGFVGGTVLAGSLFSGDGPPTVVVRPVVTWTFTVPVGDSSVEALEVDEEVLSS